MRPRAPYHVSAAATEAAEPCSKESTSLGGRGIYLPRPPIPWSLHPYETRRCRTGRSSRSRALVEVLHGQRDTLHVERRDVLAHKWAPRGIAPVFEKLTNRTPYHEELLVLGGPKSVQMTAIRLESSTGASAKTRSTRIRATSAADLRSSSPTPGSPCMPWPTSILPSGTWKSGAASPGSVQTSETHGHGTGTIVGLGGDAYEIVKRDARPRQRHPPP